MSMEVILGETFQSSQNELAWLQEILTKHFFSNCKTCNLYQSLYFPLTFFFCPYVYPQLIQFQSYRRQRTLYFKGYLEFKFTYRSLSFFLSFYLSKDSSSFLSLSKDSSSFLSLSKDSSSFLSLSNDSLFFLSLSVILRILAHFFTFRTEKYLSFFLYLSHYLPMVVPGPGLDTLFSFFLSTIICYSLRLLYYPPSVYLSLNLSHLSMQ